MQADDYNNLETSAMASTPARRCALGRISAVSFELQEGLVVAAFDNTPPSLSRSAHPPVFQVLARSDLDSLPEASDLSSLGTPQLQPKLAVPSFVVRSVTGWHRGRWLLTFSDALRSLYPLEFQALRGDLISPPPFELLLYEHFRVEVHWQLQPWSA